MKYGVIGEKLPHSYSGDIFKIIASYPYEVHEVAKEDVNAFMTKREFCGINVTIPYKQTVIPYLYAMDDAVKTIGACNVVVNKNGKLYGHNTDFEGMCRMIHRAKMDFHDSKVLILGTGGTSKTANAVAKHLGAKTCITVSRKESATAVSYETVYAKHRDADFIINTTPCGMYPYADGNETRKGTPIDISLFTNLHGVVDAIYNPLRTNLILDAKKRNIPVADGLYMLTSQAILSAEYFTDVKYDESAYENTYLAMLQQKQNIVLIGMPGCGKTTVGKLLAKEINRPFYDTDAEIVKKTGKSIPAIFQEVGEDGFRKVEAEVIREISNVSGAVIATGGGAILRQENIRALCHTGRLYFLNRNLENILPTDDRPLSLDREALEKRYRERYSLYLGACDKEIKTDENVEHTLDAIKEDFLKR